MLRMMVVKMMFVDDEEDWDSDEDDEWPTLYI